MGRPSFKPTTEQRSQVQMLATIGIPHELIATFIGLGSDKTLRKHFRKELTIGDAQATAQVAEVAKEMASSGEFPVMTMFWINTVGNARALKTVKERRLTQIITITSQPEPRWEHESKQNAKGEWVHVRHLDPRPESERGRKRLAKAAVESEVDAEGDEHATE